MAIIALVVSLGLWEVVQLHDPRQNDEGVIVIVPH